MVTVLITSFLLFAAISYAIYWWQRDSSNENAERALPPPAHTGGLFSEVNQAEEAAFLAAEREAGAAAHRSALLARAAAGDRKTLDEARASGDAGLYNEALDALTERADSDESLLSLVSYVARNDHLQVNQKLAAKFVEAWKRSPDRSSTAKVLHVAALAGDASVYQQAIETVVQLWRDGRVPLLAANELRQLAESEYWLLPADSRSSGAGFVLKRTLARLRRELAASTNGRQS